MFQADSVRDAAFGCDWVGTAIPFQRCLMFIIATANNEFKLTAGKFVPVSNFTTKNVCMYVYDVCTYYVYMYVRMYGCIRVCIYVCMFLCMCVFIPPSHPREHKLHSTGFLITEYNSNP
jgi:hypothetical protein